MNSNFKKSAKQVLITVALTVATTSAFAAGANYNYPGNLESQSSKTRAEVRQELAQARASGLQDTKPNQYRDPRSYADNRPRNESSAASAQPAKRHLDPSSLYFGA